MTSDPAIYEYMSQSKNGEGGIYNITNLNLYHYAGNNPVKYTDPDGRIDLLAFFGGIGLGIATLAEDIFSFGAGIADDPLTLVAAAALIVAEFAVSDAATSVTDGSVALPGAVANPISRTEEKADTKGVAVSATDTKKNDFQIMYHYSSVSPENWSKDHRLSSGHYITLDLFLSGQIADKKLAIPKDRATGQDRIPTYRYSFLVKEGQYIGATNSLPGNKVAPLDGKPSGGKKFINIVDLVWITCEPLGE